MVSHSEAFPGQGDGGERFLHSPTQPFQTSDPGSPADASRPRRHGTTPHIIAGTLRIGSSGDRQKWFSTVC